MYPGFLDQRRARTHLPECTPDHIYFHILDLFSGSEIRRKTFCFTLDSYCEMYRVSSLAWNKDIYQALRSLTGFEEVLVKLYCTKKSFELPFCILKEGVWSWDHPRRFIRDGESLRNGFAEALAPNSGPFTTYNETSTQGRHYCCIVFHPVRYQATLHK